MSQKVSIALSRYANHSTDQCRRKHVTTPAFQSIWKLTGGYHRQMHRSVDNTSPVRVKSSTTDADAAAAADAKTSEFIENAKFAANARQQKRPQFPWRHESLDNPIPRLVPGTVEFRQDTVSNIPSQTYVAYLFLQMPIWQMFFLNKVWRNDLAEACAFAFSQGVAGILSNIYSLPSCSSDDLQIRFLYPPKIEKNNEEGIQNIKQEMDREKIEKTSTTDDSSKNMLSEPLRKLFQSAYENGKDQFQIRLETEPVKAILYNIVCSPFVTREAFERDPNLHDEYVEVIKTLRTNFQEGMTRWFGIFPRIIKDGKAQTTVEIQVLVECTESFQVSDRETGVILQGSKDGAARKVLHVVRLERVVTTSFQDSFPYMFNSNYGNWKISDIDDLVITRPWLRPMF